MSEWKTIDSPTWKEILKHRFFIAFNKDLYIEELLNEIAKTISEQDQKLEAMRGVVAEYPKCDKNGLAFEWDELITRILAILDTPAQNTEVNHA